MPNVDPALEGRHAAGSPLGIGDPIIAAGNDARRNTATNVQPVYNNGVASGWVYTSDHGDHYFQENMASRSTWGGGIKNFSGSESQGPPVKLDPNVPVSSQLPEGSQLRPGPSVERDTKAPHPKGLEPGKSFAGSPFAIGDDIPNGDSTFTQVTNINAVKDKESGRIQGYLYEGRDGKIYGQRVDSQPISVGVGAGPVSASVTASGQKAVVPSDPPGTLDYGAIPPPNLRNQRIPMEGDKPLGLQHWTDAFKHKKDISALPGDAQEMKPGQQVTGKVLGNDDTHMYIDGGRVAYSVPLEKLPESAARTNPGDTVNVGVGRSGDASLAIKPDTPSLGVGRA